MLVGIKVFFLKRVKIFFKKKRVKRSKCEKFFVFYIRFFLDLGVFEFFDIFIWIFSFYIREIRFYILK